MAAKYRLRIPPNQGVPVTVEKRFTNPWNGRFFYSEVRRYRPFFLFFRFKSFVADLAKKLKPTPVGRAPHETQEMQDKVKAFEAEYKKRAHPGNVIRIEVNNVKKP